MSDVVVTGTGVVSALGVGREAFWNGLKQGRSGLRPMERFDATGLRNDLAGEVPQSPELPAGSPLHYVYSVHSVHEALNEADLDPAVCRPGRLALVCATNFGGQQSWDTLDDQAERFAQLDFHGPATHLAQQWAPAPGHVVTLSNACSSGTNALGHAADLVRLGLADVAIACGYDELAMFCLSGLSILHTITADTIRPFDRNRSGTIFGEGAAALVVESAEHAAARGATPLATVLGYGVNNNAYHMTAPDKGGEGMVHAIRMALAQAQLDPSRIGHINAHATGTEYHDPAETQAIKTVLGQHAYEVPVSATKAATGHCMGAAGAMEAVACVWALVDQVAPPTLNLEEPDPECDLDCVPGEARPASFEVALSVSAGLGGNNAAVLLGKV